MSNATTNAAPNTIRALVVDDEPLGRERVRSLLEAYRGGEATLASVRAALRPWASGMRTERFQGWLSPYPAELETS